MFASPNLAKHSCFLKQVRQDLLAEGWFDARSDAVVG
jgi:hypothetical protein